MKAKSKSMNLKARITLAITNFFRKYGRIILIIFFAWLIIFLINRLLIANPQKKELSNTYNPDSPVIDDTTEISKPNVKKINKTIKEYFDYCNNKEYDKAFEYLTTDCKKYLYNDDISYFKTYIDNIFTSKKTYNVQNYSNVGKIYIYTLTILDDIEATGTTNSDDGEGNYEKYQEKIALKKVDNGFKISNNNFIQTEEINKTTEDDYLKITVTSKDESYSMEGYNLTITNKTNGYALISDGTVNNEVQLDIGDQQRKALNISNGQFYVGPGETKKMTFIFRKYFDDGKEGTEIRLNLIRLLKTFKGEDGEDTVQKASKAYSLNVKLQ